MSDENLIPILNRQLSEAQYGTSDRERAAEYILKASGDQLGAGDDPVGFLIAAHAYQADLLAEAKRHLSEMKLAIEKSCDEDRQEILSRGHGGCPEAARLAHELELCRAVTTLCCKKATKWNT